jgi:hypothetical protein
VAEGPESGAERARRLDCAARVAGAMLHEVRNVLNPIVSAAFLLDVNAENPTRVRELAKRIEGFAKAEERVAAKMRELLDREAAGDEAGPTAGVSPATASSSTQAPRP